MARRGCGNAGGSQVIPSRSDSSDRPELQVKVLGKTRLERLKSASGGSYVFHLESVEILGSNQLI